MQTERPLPSISLSKPLESVLNTAIRLDEMHGAAFNVLENRVIAITLAPIEQPLYFLFTPPPSTPNNTARIHISVQTKLQGEPDAALHTTLLDFISLPVQRTLPNASLSGETALAQHFINALCTLDIDWEEHLSHYTGDLIAFKVGHGVRTLFNTQQQLKKNIEQTAGQTLREYLQFEIEALPTQHQITRFCQDVHAIVKEVDTLEQRILALPQLEGRSHEN